MPNIRDTINAGDANRLDSALQQVKAGDLVSLLIAAMTPTQSSVTVTSSLATLANQPSSIFQINASAGGVTGVKKLLIGPSTGPGAITPKTGEALWVNRGKTVLFSTADAVTAAHFTYATDADTTASCMQRDIGQRD